MPQSIYEAAIMLQAPTQGPTDHIRLDEASGTVITNYGISAIPYATNGTVVRGNASLLAGDPAGWSTGQTKDTVMATRGHSALFDRPDLNGIANKLTVLCWFRPDEIRPGGSGSEYVLVMKGGNTYGITVNGTGLRSDINGQVTPLTSDVNELFRVGVPMHVAMVFDGAAQTWKLFVNGVIVGSRALAPGQTVNHSLAGTMQIGGYNVFGATGIHGRMQHVSIFNAHAISDTQIQGLYRVGVVPPGAEGEECQYVFPWDREVVAAGGGYDTIQFRNWNPWPVHLSQGGTAIKGAGITLSPRGGAMPRPSKFRGAWNAVLDTHYGSGPLAIEKTY